MLRNEKDAKDDDFLWWIIIFSIIMASTSDAQSNRARSDTGQVAARAIIARHDSVAGRIGGLSPHRFTHAISQTEAPTIRTVTEAWTIAPNRALTRMTMEGAGTTEIGYNGVVGWTSSPMTGPVVLEGEPLKMLAMMAEGRTQMFAQLKTLAAGAPTVAEGKNVVPVTFEDFKGISGTLYFDMKTGLLHAMRQPIPEVPGGVMWTLITDYKAFDGELMALTTTIKGPGQVIVTRTTHVDHKPIDTALFNPPAEVRALLKRP